MHWPPYFSMIRVQLPDGRKMIAMSGENGVIELWNLNDKTVALTPAQILRTPVASMWALRTLPGGDIAAAASNGYIYTFTARAERAAPFVVLGDAADTCVFFVACCFLFSIIWLYLRTTKRTNLIFIAFYLQ